MNTFHKESLVFPLILHEQFDFAFDVNGMCLECLRNLIQPQFEQSNPSEQETEIPSNQVTDNTMHSLLKKIIFEVEYKVQALTNLHLYILKPVPLQFLASRI